MTAAAPRPRRRVLADRDVRPRRPRGVEPRLRRLQFARAGDFEPKIEPRRGVDPGRQHVVVVAGPGDLAAADRTALLLEGHQSAITWQGCDCLVRPLMTGIVAFAAISRFVLVEDSDHDRVDVARQHARGVGDGLAAAELHFGSGQHDRLAAELAHRRHRTRRGCGSTAGRRSSPASCRRAAARSAPPPEPRRLHRRRRDRGCARSSPLESSSRSRKCRGRLEWARSWLRFSSSPPRRSSTAAQAASSRRTPRRAPRR